MTSIQTPTKLPPNGFEFFLCVAMADERRRRRSGSAATATPTPIAPLDHIKVVSGAYQLAGATIEVARLGATRMACADPVMDRERLLLNVLESARTFSRDRTRLTLSDGTGRELARFVQTDWE